MVEGETEAKRKPTLQINKCFCCAKDCADSFGCMTSCHPHDDQ